MTQTYCDWSLHASDDGSSDGTIDILHRYQALFGEDRMSVKIGPCEGYAANFISLSCGVHPPSDLYAFSDQDDIWEPDKLERAVTWLTTISPSVPALYCSRTQIVNQNNVSMGLSPMFKQQPGFYNALIQNLAGGNTMVFNEAARQIIIQAHASSAVVSHDWWLYILTTACGGEVYYDLYPSVRYRQHENNLVGSNNSLRALLIRIIMTVQGRLRLWNDLNIAALAGVQHLMTPESRQILSMFMNARKQFGWRRLFLIKGSGVRRQTRKGQIAFYIAAIFGKI